MRIGFLALLPLLPVLAQAQLYRWVDDAGKVHYSDRIPVSGARNVQKQSTPAQASAALLPYALQQASKNFPVTLYTSEACRETCARARAVLDQRGVPYSEVSVTDEADLAQLKQLSGGNSVPVMTVGREVYRGFDSANYKTALDIAGYPASSLLPPGVAARRPYAKPAPKAAPAPAATEGTPAPAPQEAANANAPAPGAAEAAPPAAPEAAVTNAPK